MSNGGELSCKELVELVSDYLEGDMVPQDRALLDEHLARCEGCAAYLDQIRKTIALSGTLKEDDIETPARQPLLSTFREWKAARGLGPD